MRLPVSTSGGQTGRTEVACSVVEGAVLPAAPQHAEPSAAEDAHRVRMVGAAIASPLVDVLGPWRGAAAVVGPTGERAAQPLVAGPTEADALDLAGTFGDRHHPRLHREHLVAGEALADVADLGEQLCGVGLPGAREALHHRPIGMLI